MSTQLTAAQARAEETAWARDAQPEPDPQPAPDPTHDPGVVLLPTEVRR